MRLNFSAWLSLEGKVLPKSIRRGHNVFTNYGREWLADLIAWGTISDGADSPIDVRRPRWLGLGVSSQLEQVGVVKLVSPMPFTIGPNVYLKPLAVPTWTTIVAPKYTFVIDANAGTDFEHCGTLDLTEAALYVDRYRLGDTGPLLDVSQDDNIPVAYKTFEPLTFDPFSLNVLTINWEFLN